MELRERLLQSADWCDANELMLDRIKRIGADLRDAAAEIEALEDSRMGWSAHSRGLIATLEEQLSMAKTEAKDVQSFRERENSEAQHIILGMKMAIQAMVAGMKGGE